MKKIELPEGLEVIEEGCFGRSGLEKIVIPKSVTKIKEWAFSECKSLWKVIFEEGSKLKKL